MPYIIRKYEKQKEGRCGNMGRRLGSKNGIRMGPTKNVRNTQFRFPKRPFWTTKKWKQKPFFDKVFDIVVMFALLAIITVGISFLVRNTLTPKHNKNNETVTSISSSSSSESRKKKKKSSEGSESIANNNPKDGSGVINSVDESTESIENPNSPADTTSSYSSNDNQEPTLQEQVEEQKQAIQQYQKDHDQQEVQSQLDPIQDQTSDLKNQIKSPDNNVSQQDNQNVWDSINNSFNNSISDETKN